MNTTEEKTKVLMRGILKIQEEDFQSVLNKLDIDSKEAKDRLRLIRFCPSNNHNVEYQIIDYNTLEVYVHGKIDFNIFTDIGHAYD